MADFVFCNRDYGSLLTIEAGAEEDAWAILEDIGVNPSDWDLEES